MSILVPRVVTGQESQETMSTANYSAPMCSACCGVAELHADVSRLLQKNLGSSSKPEACPLCGHHWQQSCIPSPHGTERGPEQQAGAERGWAAGSAAAGQWPLWEEVHRLLL